MPDVNVLLQLFKGGWREQTSPVIPGNLRIEGLLGSGAVESVEEAERIAVGQLDLYADPALAETVALEPAGISDTPWLSHVPGNTITRGSEQELVESLSFKRDQNGHITYATELNNHVDTPEERLSLSMKKMANGTFGGVSRVAQPVNQTPTIPQYTPPLNLGGCPCSAFVISGNSFADGTSTISLVADDDISKLFDLSDANAAYEYNQGEWNAVADNDELTTDIYSDESGLFVTGGFARLLQLSGSGLVSVQLDVLPPNGFGSSSSVYPPTSGAYTSYVSGTSVGWLNFGEGPVIQFGVTILGPAAGSVTRAFTLVDFYVWGYTVCGCPSLPLG